MAMSSLLNPSSDWELKPFPEGAEAAPAAPSFLLPGRVPLASAGSGMLCRWLPGQPRPASWLPSGSTEHTVAPPSIRSPPGPPSLVQNHLENGSALGGIFSTGLARETAYVSGREGWEGWEGGRRWGGPSLFPTPGIWLPWAVPGRGLLPPLHGGRN